MMLDFKLRAFPWRLLSVLLLSPIGCSGASARPQGTHAIPLSSTVAGVTPLPRNPCEVAAELRGKVAGFLAEGRLDRTVRLIQKANRLCVTSAPVTWGQEVSTLAELGMYAEARELAKTIEAAANAGLDAKNSAAEALARCARLDKEFPDTDEAKAEMWRLSEEASKVQDKPDEASQRLVKETFLTAWEAWHPNAKALVSAGLAAKKLGQNADAQRLFDRALVDAEKEQGHAVALELPGGLRGRPRKLAWSRDGRFIALAEWHENWGTISIFDRTWRVRVRIQLSRFDGSASLAFSPDGKTLASGKDNGKGIILWDAASGNELRTIMMRAPASYSIEYSPDGKTSIAYSPDGKTLAAGLSDTTVRVWDVATGKEIQALEGHTGKVTSVAYSPDGKTLASASADKSVRLWDVTSGKELRRLAHPIDVTSIAYSPDGKTLASGSRGHTDYTPDGKTLFYGDTLHFWNVATGKPLQALNVGGDVTSVAYSPDGKTLALGGRTAILWDVASGKERQRLVGHTFGANAVVYSPDGKMLVSISDMARVWDAATGKELQVLGERSTSIQALRYSPDGKTLASGMADNTVQLWDPHTGKQFRTLAGHTGAVQSVAYSPESDMVATGSSDKTVRLWEVASGKELRQFVGHTEAVNSVAYSPNGLTLASGSDDKTVRLWDVATGNERQTLGEYSDGGHAVAYSPNGKMLASASEYSQVLLWDVATGKRLRALVGHQAGVVAAAFSPDGMTLVSWGENDAARLWNVTTGKELRAFDEWSSYPIFSPDGKTLAGGEQDNSKVVLRDIRGMELKRFKSNDCVFLSYGYSPDGETLACGTRDGSILLFALDEGVLAATLRDAGIPGTSYVFTPSGHIDIQGPNACAARDKLACRVGVVFFPFDVCEERFFVADLLSNHKLGATSFAEPESVTPRMRCAGASPPPVPSPASP